MEQGLVLFFSAKEYYEELYYNFQKAEHNIFILGWDIHSNVDLVPHFDTSEMPKKLFDLLNRIATLKPQLNIYILPWEYNFIYFAEREHFLKAKSDWVSPKNVHLKFDSSGPIGASQHQKVIVIDDSIAYCGGIDLTMHRWDDSKHLANNPLRKLNNGKSYPPFHDIQIKCSGKQVKDFAKLVRERWSLATGEEVSYEEPIEFNEELLKTNLGLYFEIEKMKMIQTRSDMGEELDRKEFYKSYCDLIKNASSYIYIENQYLSSEGVTDALEKRLNDTNSPLVIIVLPRLAGDWLEQETLGRIQYKRLMKLNSTKNHKNLLVIYPYDDELKKDEYIVVHSKIILVDGKKLIVGSANLTSRSMGLDSEAGVMCEGDFDHLLSHFLSSVSGLEHSEVIKYFNGDENKIEAIKNLILKNPSKGLAYYDIKKRQHWLPSEVIPDESILDLEAPIKADQEVNYYSKQVSKRWKVMQKIGHNWGLVFTVLTALIMVIVWRDLIKDPEYRKSFYEFINWLRKSPLASIYICLVYFFAGIVFIPINVMIFLTASIFKPIDGFIYATVGTQFFCAGTYLWGMLLYKFVKKKPEDKSSGKVVKALKSNSLLSLALIRVLPIAPSVVIGSLAGYFKVSFLKFQLGSAIGIAPGTLALIFFQKSLFEMFREINVQNVSTFVVILLIIAFLYNIVKKRYQGQ